MKRVNKSSKYNLYNMEPSCFNSLLVYQNIIQIQNVLHVQQFEG